MIKNPFFTIILLAVLFIDKTTAAEIEYFGLDLLPKKVLLFVSLVILRLK